MRYLCDVLILVTCRFCSCFRLVKYYITDAMVSKQTKYVLISIYVIQLLFFLYSFFYLSMRSRYIIVFFLCLKHL